MNKSDKNPQIIGFRLFLPVTPREAKQSPYGIFISTGRVYAREHDTSTYIVVWIAYPPR